MKKVFTFILCAVLSVNIALAQSQSSAARSHRHIKSIHANEIQKGIAEISGGITSLNNYVPGSTSVLNFEITVVSPDEEYLDGLSMTFPTGMTPIVTGTSDPITALTGCSSATGQLNTISGQTITWGEITTPTGCGYLEPGVYNFSVGVTIGAITGSQSITYTAFGDGYGSAPHSFTGTIQVNEASTNDVGVSVLTLNTFYQPAAVVSPVAIIQNFGTAPQTFDVAISFHNGTSFIYNDTVTVTALAVGDTQLVSFDNWTAVIGNYTAVVKTMSVGDTLTNNDSITKNFIVASAFPAYAWNAYDASSPALALGPVEILIPAGQITSLVNDTVDFMSGADFVNGQWFAAQYSSTGNSNIYTIDKTTGIKTLVGASGVGITGLAYDVVSSKLFASVYANSANSLYTINTGTGVATLVGPITTAGLVIGIASNNAGDIYGITLNDTLITINKTTGAATLVGPLGLNINYAQDIAFDRDNNKLYGTLYTTTGVLAEINTTTGAATTLTTFGPEIDGFAIPYTYVLPDTDVTVQSITPIISGCGLSNSNNITIRVANNGNDPQSSIPVYYTINGGAQVNGTVAGPIAPGAYADYTFTTVADLSAFGTYAINACTNLANDANTNNDCNAITVTNIQPSAIPYTMGFESNDNVAGWKITDANSDNFPWAYIQQQSLARTGTGLAIYEYNTDATTGADDWMFSTCINLTGGTAYELSFWYKVGVYNGTVYPEKLKVSMGTSQTVSGMTQVIKDLGTISDTAYTKSATVFTPATTGTYYLGWYAYSAADAFYIAIDDIKIDVPSGINEINNENSISLYPNPAKNQLNISSNNSIENIKVINAIGQVMVNQKIDAQFHTLNTSSYNYGVYFIQIETKDGIVTKRFVIAE